MNLQNGGRDIPVTSTWHDLGPVEILKNSPLQEISIDGTRIALSFAEGEFSAIGGVCAHVGGPLGAGTLSGDEVVCPWHYFRYHRKTGICRLGESHEIAVPRYELKIEGEHLFLNLAALSPGKPMGEYHGSLTRPIQREPGPIRIAGISTTIMTPGHPRYSTSEDLLETALEHGRAQLQAETKTLRLRDLHFRPCEGYYSKSVHACLWPCTITRGDKNDELSQVYEALIYWADVILIATPIRWGAASSLYYKMVERMNCIQNQITLHNKVLIQNKVASFIITGGQDNIQLVAGQMLGFFAELGFLFPPFPFIAHSLGWNAENMERNMKYVQRSRMLRQGARELVRRAVNLSRTLVESPLCESEVERAGRKASPAEG
ncbi:MAG TPA: (2Fe-2S)-binding protein [Deltaproteobacteria bacterium]|nr:(2Fe-2S)-binding protein [Deltaproteobacteria bacterium]